LAQRSKAAGLPALVSSFVGRAEELSRLAGLLGHARLVTVVGPGGSGKTRLAIEAAHNGTFNVLGFVQLAAVRDASLVPVAILAGCGIREEPGRDPLERLLAALREVEGVLVLDNCEHLLEGLARVVAGLLRCCPALRVLATSRATLGVEGEIVLPLAGLPVTDTHEGGGAPGMSGDAVALFVKRARALQPSFLVGVDTLESVRAICRMVDGLPLGIELAAVHARGLSVDEIRDGMADRLRFLTRDAAVALPRHRSLHASIDWSYRLAGAEARRMLRALSVIAGRFSLAVAAAIAGYSSRRAVARELLETLVDHSLVQFAPGEDAPYVLLETIRDFAERELIAAGEDEEVHTRLLLWVADMARAARRGLDRASAQTLRQVARDEPAVRAALDRAVRTGSGLDVASEVVASLAFFWSLRGRCVEGQAWAGRLTAALDPPPCGLLWATAFLAAYGGDVAEGALQAQRAADAAASLGDAGIRARALIIVGMIELLEDPALAHATVSIAVGLAQQVEDDWASVEALQMLAYACLVQADHRAAVIHLDKALPILDRLGHSQLRAWDAAGRAEAAVQSGRFTEAETEARRGLALSSAVGEPVSAVFGLAPLVKALLQTGRLDDALAALEQMRPFFATHPGFGVSEILGVSRALVALWHDPGSAVDDVRDAARAAAAFGTAWLAGEGAAMLSLALLAQQDPQAARAASEEALAWAERCGNPETACLANLAHAAADRALGAFADAVGPAYRALADAAEFQFLPLIPDALDLVAGVALDHGRPAVTARLHAASDRHRRDLGVRPSPFARLFRDRDERAMARLLDPDARRAAREEGTRLDLERAVSYASRARGRRTRPRFGWDSLTPTELEVVALAAKGLSNPAIGRDLLITDGTVRTHLRSVFAKLGVATRAELAAEAARRGL
jgi:predicted ATPase/DNA-binding CsgD family transcriptional regulator